MRFASTEAAGGMVLLGCTLLALIWANSPWKHGYEQFLATKVSIGFGKFFLTEDRLHWINDGLMSLFFFLVGLEIKREVLVGELSSLRRAVLPIVAAVGGVIFPALTYTVLTSGSDVGKGWAIPIATDIAFALGVLTVLGSRVPIALKVFVTALAIVDDILAVIVIAVFYTDQINRLSLIIGLTCIGLSLLANVVGIRKPPVYAVIGVLAWCAVLNSGVHATIAGILLAFTIPAGSVLNKTQFLEHGRSLLDDLEGVPPNSSDEHAIIHTLEQKLEQADSPLHRIERQFHPWISFVVVPLFAFANAGVNVSAYIAAAIKHPVIWGIGLGLVIGKPLGIWLFSVVAVKTGIALPLENVSRQQILGCGFLCGIGFTMSLFVADLAFEEGESLAISKIAILGGSLASAALGSVLLARKPDQLSKSNPRENQEFKFSGEVNKPSLKSGIKGRAATCVAGICHCVSLPPIWKGVLRLRRHTERSVTKKKPSGRACNRIQQTPLHKSNYRKTLDSSWSMELAELSVILTSGVQPHLRPTLEK